MINRDSEIRHLHSLGQSWLQIGDRIGASRQAVARAAVRMGLEMNRQNSWSQAEIDKVTPLWLDGKSASEIARVMPGRSRNAIIGIVHRLGLSRTGATVQRVRREPTMARPARAPKVRQSQLKPPKPGQQNRPAVIFGAVGVLNPVEVEKKRQKFRAHGQDAVAYVAAGADVESPNARPWMERLSGECKWPLDERGAVRFCCNPVERGSYCAGHAAVAFVPVNPDHHTSKARVYARFDRVEPTVRQPKPKPTSIWDEARAA